MMRDQLNTNKMLTELSASFIEPRYIRIRSSGSVFGACKGSCSNRVTFFMVRRSELGLSQRSFCGEKVIP